VKASADLRRSLHAAIASAIKDEAGGLPNELSGLNEARIDAIAGLQGRKLSPELLST
jgi:hypothetical protein